MKLDGVTENDQELIQVVSENGAASLIPVRHHSRYSLCEQRPLELRSATALSKKKKPKLANLMLCVNA